MTAARFHLSREQVFSNSGTPLAGAKLFFYVTGTLTPLNTYSNAALSSLNANPVVADSNGRFGDIFLQDQTYRVILKDTTEATTFFDTDPVYKDVTFIRSAGLPAVSFPNMLVYNTSDGKKYRRNSTGSGWIDEGPIDSAGNTAGVSDVVAGTSTSLFATPDAIAGLWERGTDIASASTLSIPAGAGGYFEVTGTTTINGINSQRSGLEVELRFQDVLTLTHGSSFVLFNSANITTEAGDIARLRNVSAVGTSGTDWRLVGYTRANGGPVYSPAPASKTATYLVVDADRGGYITFSGLSANVELQLPAASGRKGFEVTFINLDTTGWGVTVNPNGSETIDLVSTRKTHGKTPITLYCDGTGWKTKNGVYTFISTDITVTAGADGAIAHGLGYAPTKMWWYLVNTSAELNYSVGDKVYSHGGDTTSGIQNGWGISTASADANTNISYVIGSGANPIFISNKTTGAQGTITPANWKFVVCCEC